MLKEVDNNGANNKHFIDFTLNQQSKGLFSRQNVEAECNVIIFGASQNYTQILPPVTKILLISTGF